MDWLWGPEPDERRARLSTPSPNWLRHNSHKIQQFTFTITITGAVILSPPPYILGRLPRCAGS